MTAENEGLIVRRTKEEQLPLVSSVIRLVRFMARCNGGVKLPYGLYQLDYDTDSVADWMERKDEFPPVYAIVFKHPSGEKAMIIIDDRRKKKIAAEEITDPICLKNSCEGGRNCLAKRLKRKA